MFTKYSNAIGACIPMAKFIHVCRVFIKSQCDVGLNAGSEWHMGNQLSACWLLAVVFLWLWAVVIDGSLNIRMGPARGRYWLQYGGVNLPMELFHACIANIVEKIRSYWKLDAVGEAIVLYISHFETNPCGKRTACVRNLQIGLSQTQLVACRCTPVRHKLMWYWYW